MSDAAERRRAYNREYSRRWRAENPDKVREKNRQQYLKRKANGYHMEWWEKAGAVKRREYKFRCRLKKFGLTIEMYEALAAKGCEICGMMPGDWRRPKGPNDKNACLHIDHDHETGGFRGLLCNRCNRAIGLLRDCQRTIENAVVYLERTSCS